MSRFRRFGVVLSLALLIAVLESCATTGASSSRAKAPPVIGSEDFPSIERGAHGRLAVRLNFIPHSIMWDERVDLDGYFNIVDSGFNFNDPERGVEANKYRPPLYPSRLTTMRLEEYYTPPDENAAFDLADQVSTYFEHFEKYEYTAQQPGEWEREVVEYQPPALLVLLEHKESGAISGGMLRYYATERGKEIASDDDFQFFVEQDPDSLYWKPEKGEAVIPLEPGDYELRYRLLVYDAAPSDYGFFELLLRSMFGTNTFDYVTVVIADGDASLSIESGDSVSIELRDVAEGLEVVENQQ